MPSSLQSTFLNVNYFQENLNWRSSHCPKSVAQVTTSIPSHTKWQTSSIVIGTRTNRNISVGRKKIFCTSCFFSGTKKKLKRNEKVSPTFEIKFLNGRPVKHVKSMPAEEKKFRPDRQRKKYIFLLSYNRRKMTVQNE